MTHHGTPKAWPVKTLDGSEERAGPWVAFGKQTSVLRVLFRPFGFCEGVKVLEKTRGTFGPVFSGTKGQWFESTRAYFEDRC